MPELAGHTYVWVPATDPAVDKVLLTLHGTGGDENDLLDLAQTLAPGTAVLSPRGQVKEGAANRFFRRLAEGVFDLEDLRLRTEALGAFVDEALREHLPDGMRKVVAVGFSNGANVAASLLLRRPYLLSGAVLLRAMVPFEPERVPEVRGMPVLILSGDRDPIVPPENAARLAQIFQEAGADVEHRIVPAGHGLTRADVEAARTWLARH